MNTFTRPAWRYRTRLSTARHNYIALLAAYEDIKAKLDDKAQAAWKLLIATAKPKAVIGPGRVTVDSQRRQDRSIYMPRISTPKALRRAKV